MAEAKDSCVKPAKGPIGPPEAQTPAINPNYEGGTQNARSCRKTCSGF